LAVPYWIYDSYQLYKLGRLEIMKNVPVGRTSIAVGFDCLDTYFIGKFITSQAWLIAAAVNRIARTPRWWSLAPLRGAHLVSESLQ
jgi:hypothetical protein